MNSTVYASTLNNTIGEIKKICPEVSNAFVFKNSDLIANDDTTSKDTLDQAVDALNSLEKEAKTVGGLKSIRIEGTKGKMNLSCMDKVNLATVLSNQADENYVNTLTKVLVPTVIKLVDEIQVNSPKKEADPPTEPKPAQEPSKKDADTKQEISQELTEKEIPLVEFVEPPPNEEVKVEELNSENNKEDLTQPFEEKSGVNFGDRTFLDEPPVTQLIVENLGGLLVPSDTVRIDREIIEKWNELYEDKEIKMVYIENINGKSTQSKFKNIKSSKYAGKGVIRIPEKIQSILETSIGELITIKPIIE